MNTFSIHATSPTRLCSSVHNTYHAKDHTRNGRDRPKQRMQILIQSASEEKIKEYNPDSDKR